MGVPPWGTCSLNSPWVLGHCSAASLFTWPCLCPHMRHQPGPGLRGPSGCSQVLSAPAALALCLYGSGGSGSSWQASGWRVLAAHCCVVLTPGAISLPVAFMRLLVSAITAHLPSTRDAGWLCLDCSLLPGGPVVLLMGRGGRTCALYATLPSLEMHTPRVAWAAPARARSHMCSSGTWKSPFPRAPHGERNACLVSLLCTEPDTRLLFSELFFIPLF